MSNPNPQSDAEELVNEQGPCLSALQTEYHRAGTYSSGASNIEFNENTRRMRWPGQSPDGRIWDRNQPDGEEALPWNGASDTRVPAVDEVINEEVDTEVVGFHKADLRGLPINADRTEAAGRASTYLHWLVRRKMRRQLMLEVELAAQYTREYSWCVAYVGWEREVGKRRRKVTLEELTELAQAAMQQRLAQVVKQAQAQGQSQGQGQPQPQPPAEEADENQLTPEQLENYAQLPTLIGDPSQEAAAAEILRDVYQFYVQGQMRAAGFFEEEVEDGKYLQLESSTARKYVKALRNDGTVQMVVPYVVKNGAVVYILKPWAELMVPIGTAELQKARVIFWRRRMALSELMVMRGTWNEEWIDAAIKTIGLISSWATTVSTTSPGPGRELGGIGYSPLPVPGDDHVEVVYGFVRKVDEEGVSGIYLTVFSPHIQKGDDGAELVAIHELVDHSHGMYPFIERKRENLGRGLEETRGVPEIANTWQMEEKCQRDGLFNRTQLDTVPPIRVPALGGINYRLGPAAQIPMKASDKIEALNLGGKEPTLAIELLTFLKQRTDHYFARNAESVSPQRTQTHQLKMFQDSTDFWGLVFLMCFSLELQYNKGQVARVCGVSEEELDIDPARVMEELDCGVEFDIRELNPDFLWEKMEAMNKNVLPNDVGGALDRNAWTEYQARAMDPLLARRLVMDKGQASQKVFADVQRDFVLMSDGQEPSYGTDADPTAPSKMEFAQQIIKANPKYQARLTPRNPAFDPMFAKLVTKYGQNLQFNVDQQQNKQTGRMGVKPGASAQ